MPKPTTTVLLTLWVATGIAVALLVLRPEPAARHVILVVLDTLRADRMSVYGCERDTTPFLRENQSQFLKFANAKAVAPWTMPSHASMFTGVLPAVHRAQWGSIRLRPEFTTLAEVLQDNDFSTVCLAANPFFGKTFGLTQGFDVHTYVDGPARFKTEKIMADLPGILDQELDRRQRLFVFLNLMDTHIGYNHHRYGGQFGLSGRPPIGNAKEKWKVSAGQLELPPEDVKSHRAAYDAAVRYLDDVLREIVELLKSRGILDQTLLMITSDHGEGLGFHQELGHSISVWEEQLAIPLLVRLPAARRGGEVVSTPVSMVGLAPFVLDHLGVTRPEALLEATSLDHWSDNPVSADYRSYFGDTKRTTNVEMAELYPGLRQKVRPRHVVYCGLFKLVIDDLGGVEFFDLHNDPHEQHNLAAEASWEFDACVDTYYELRSTSRFTPFSAAGRRTDIDEKQAEVERDALRALGYVH